MKEISHWEKWIIEDQNIVYIVFNIILLPPTVKCCILCLKKLGKQTIFNINVVLSYLNDGFTSIKFPRWKTLELYGRISLPQAK